jgi:hypothetical protein
MWLVLSSKKKSLSCMFWSNVPCLFRKSKKSTIMNRCLKCPHFKRFQRDIEKEEDEFFEFCDRVWADPQGYLEGRIR